MSVPDRASIAYRIALVKRDGMRRRAPIPVIAGDLQSLDAVVPTLPAVLLDR